MGRQLERAKEKLKLASYEIGEAIVFLEDYLMDYEGIKALRIFTKRCLYYNLKNR